MFTIIKKSDLKEDDESQTTRKNVKALTSKSLAIKMATAHASRLRGNAGQVFKLEAGICGTGISQPIRQFKVSMAAPNFNPQWTQTVSWAMCYDFCPHATNFINATVPTAACPIFDEMIPIYDNWRMTSFDMNITILPPTNIGVALDTPSNFDVFARVIPSVVPLNLPTFNATIPQFFEGGAYQHFSCSTGDRNHNVKVHWRMDDTNSNLWGNTGECDPYYHWYIFLLVTIPFVGNSTTPFPPSWCMSFAHGNANLQFKTIKIADV